MYVDMTEKTDERSSISVNEQTRDELRLLKAEKGFVSYEELIREDYLDNYVYEG